MDKLIYKSSKLPFSDSDILELCDNDTKIYKYGELSKLNNIDEAFGLYDNIVILYETKPNYGHWVCLLKTNKQGILEYFDPLAYKLDDILNYIDNDFKKLSNQNIPHLSRLIYNSGYKVIENKYKIQKEIDDISTCGRHVSMRIILKNYPLNEYLKLFKNNKLNPDEIVTYLTSFVK